MKISKKEDLVHQAKQLFLNKGYGNTSILDIAKKSNMAKSQVYYYFTSKEMLGQAVIQDEINTINTYIFNPIMQQDISAEAKLKMLIIKLYENYVNLDEKANYGFLLEDIAIETSPENFSYRKTISDVYLAWHSIFEKIIDEIKSPIDLPGTASEQATFLLNSLMGGMQNLRVMQNTNVMDVSIRSTLYIFLHTENEYQENVHTF